MVRPRLARWEHTWPQGAAVHQKKKAHIQGPKTLLFENAMYLKTLNRSHFLRPFYFDLNDRLHIRAN